MAQGCPTQGYAATRFVSSFLILNISDEKPVRWRKGISCVWDVVVFYCTREIYQYLVFMARPAHACSNCGAEIEFPVKTSDQLVQCLACGGNIYQVMTQAADPPLQPPTDPEPAIGSMYDHPAAPAYQPQTATATPRAPQGRLERKVKNATKNPPMLFWALSYIYTSTLKNIQVI